jgi:thiosulfate reductase cytochrome b subunit
MTQFLRIHLTRRKSMPALALLVAGLLIALGVQQALASGTARPAEQPSPLHPAFTLLDAQGTPVPASGQPLSTMKTCGQCHDTTFIATHSFHADLGYSETQPAGQVAGGRPWDTSTGLYGKWDPLTYRYLSPAGDTRTDLTPAQWVQFYGARIAGGGPAAAATGLEMNCFLCHTAAPNNAARTAALAAGDFAWANTATLLGSGIVDDVNGKLHWNANAFDAQGLLKREFITIQDPTNQNCAQCHGLVHGGDEPLTTLGRDLNQWQTATTGQIISPQKIAESGVNLAGKDALERPWDIHAERGLTCVDCHYSLNNPVLAQSNAKSEPGHIIFDPRRIDLGEYLQMPSHQFARGESAQYTVAPELKGTMRRCESCHESIQTHSWLPYTERHMQVLACESCHIPKLYAPAVESVDWTVLQPGGTPVLQWRGVQGASGALDDLVTGYTPVLMPRRNNDGGTTIAPYNLVTAWYWVYDDPAGPRPVRLADLQAAYFDGAGAYRAEVLAALDGDRDGLLSAAELALDTPARRAAIAGLLQSAGLNHPRIESEIQPYSINHDVARGEYATRDCAVCHSDNSRIVQPLQLTGSNPTGATPAFVQDANTLATGTLAGDGGALLYRPTADDLYVFGYDRVPWIDWLGALAVLGVLAAVALHGGLRFYATLRVKRPATAVEPVYMYAVYERFWHWLQTSAILLLIVTGLIIHRPDMLGAFSFPYIVIVHNVLAAILVLNAALALFYHLASGEIKQYIPRPYGFFDQAIVQARYYLRGIFNHDAHPFEKTPQKKLNPLQQITYFGILNVLLPLQILTGALMWSAQSFPQIAGALGGLPLLAPFHSLVAWAFAAFIIAHVYLTTTGPEPLAGIRAMMLGWDEVETQAATGAGELTAQPVTAK